MATKMTGKMLRDSQRQASWDVLRDNFIFEHRFIRTLAKGLTVWTQDPTDANNLASGFDPVFKAVAVAGTGTANSFSTRGLLEVKTTGAGSDATYVIPHSVTATSYFSRASGPSLNNGYDIWVTWAVAFHSVANVDCLVGVTNLSGSAGTTVGAGTPATGTDVDFAGFVLDTSLSPNLQVVVSTGAGSGSLNYFNLGFAPTADQVYALTLKFNASTGNVDMYVDGQFRGTHGTVFRATDDSGDAVTLAPMVSIETLTTAAKTVELSGVQFEFDRNT